MHPQNTNFGRIRVAIGRILEFASVAKLNKLAVHGIST